MKTESNHPDSKINTGKQVDNHSDNWKSGVSSSIGAAAGVVAGSMAQTAFAAETTSEEVQPHPVDPIPVQPTDHTHEPTPEPESKPNVEPAPQPEPTPEPQPDPEPEITVVSYQRVTAEDGTQMDVAQIQLDEEQALVVDVDLDGQADALIADANGDGIITENEITDISQANIRMDELEQLAMQTQEETIDPNPNLLAENETLPDYTNDGDVSSYMA